MENFLENRDNNFQSLKFCQNRIKLIRCIQNFAGRGGENMSFSIARPGTFQKNPIHRKKTFTVFDFEIPLGQ